MYVLSTVFVLIYLVVRGADCKEKADRVSVECDHRKIIVSISKFNNQESNATGFYVSSDGSLDTTHCFISLDRPKVVTYFPFQLCGFQPTLSKESVIFSSSVWMIDKTGYYAEHVAFKCKYGKEFMELMTPSLLATEDLMPQSDSHPSVSLCRTPYYCPRQACLVEESFPYHAIYFENDVMHLEISLRSREKQAPMAIKELYISCGDQHTSEPEIQYYSVHEGCQTQNIRLTDLVSQDRTLRTYVDYNGQSSTMCLSVNTPPIQYCSRYYVHGTVTTCQNKSTRCPDITGWRCLNGTTASEFSYGPFYVIPRNRTRVEIIYVNEPVETTTIVSLLEETTSNFDEYFDNIEDFVPNARSAIDLRRGDNTEPMDLHGVLLPPSDSGRVTLPDKQNAVGSKKKNKSGRRNRDPKKDEGMKSPPEPEVRIHTNIIGPAENEMTDPEYSGDIDAVTRPVRMKIPKGKTARGNPRRNRKKKKKNQLVVKGVLVEEDGNDKEDKILQNGFEENTDETTFAGMDEFDIKTVPNPTRQVLGRGRIQPSLGKFTAAGGNEGFIWASVSALALFLLLSIGILAAWTANKRKRSRK